MSRYFLATLCAVLTSVFANAADLALRADYQDVIFLSATGPVRLRFHLQEDGTTVTEKWTKFADKIFDYVDRNGDGKLDKDEIRFAALLPLGVSENGPYGGGVAPPIALGGSYGRQQHNLPDFAALDTDKNGYVSRQEFAAGLQQSGCGPIQVVMAPPSGSAEQLTAALFKHLDKNKDGKLSKEELDAGFETLMRLDDDEDEIISAMELLEQGPRNTNVYQVVEAIQATGSNVNSGGALQLGSDLFTVRRESTPTDVVKELIVRLDKDKNGNLSAAELKMGAEAFAKLDKNGDGQLDRSEIAAWLADAPDVDLTVPLGGSPNAMNQMMTVNPAKRSLMEVKAAKGGALAKAIQTGADGLPRIFLPDATLTLSSNRQNQQGYFFVNFFNQNGQIDDAFKMAAGAGKGLDKKKLRESPELQYLQPLFDAADRDGDGILELAELKRYLGLHASGTDAQVQINITDEGRSLFDLIDANHDGRLGMREIRNAWKQISGLSRDGKTISRENLPKQIPMFVHRVNLTESFGAYAVSLASVDFVGTRYGSATQQGPVWFKKMDRNSDGDVSRKEFLGPPELFDRLDKDGDGLLSLDEALKAEKDSPHSPPVRKGNN